MNYIWEAVLSAKKQGIGTNELCYKQAVNPSPYLEVSFCDLNMQDIPEKEIEINPLYRFSEVFGRLLDKNTKEFLKTREILLDAAFHYLAHTDLRMGIHKQECYVDFLLEELGNGTFGIKAKQALGLFDESKKREIAFALMDVYQSGNAMEILKKLLRRLYRQSVVYGSQDQANTILIYFGVPRTEQEQAKAEFLTDTFLPVGTAVQMFFIEHFGIMDVDETMVLEHILLI